MNQSIKWSTEDIRPSGTTVEERLRIHPKSYRLDIRKAKQFNLRHRIDLLTAIHNPECLIKTLSEITTMVPNIPLDIKIRGLFSQFEGKGNSKKIRYLVFALLFIPKGWLPKIYIEERLSKILKSKYLRSKALWETRMLFELSKCLDQDQLINLIRKMYQPSNIKDWVKLGEEILKKSFFSYFDESQIINKQRKRGYTDHGSISSEKLRTERKVLSSMENRTNEEIKESILKNQLLLFERNLKQILELGSQTPDTYGDYLTKGYTELIENQSKLKKDGNE